MSREVLLAVKDILLVALGGLLGLSGSFVNDWLSHRRWRRERRRERLEKRFQPIYDYLAELLTLFSLLGERVVARASGLGDAFATEEDLARLEERLKAVEDHPAATLASLLVLQDDQLREAYASMQVEEFKARVAYTEALVTREYTKAVRNQGRKAIDAIKRVYDRMEALLDSI